MSVIPIISKHEKVTGRYLAFVAINCNIIVS